jgi:hypothetical protein
MSVTLPGPEFKRIATGNQDKNPGQKPVEKPACLITIVNAD